MTESQTLLAEYARIGSESAFRELVARYVGLVYGTALRSVEGDTHLAEDVAQAVFIDLARKARGLRGGVMLGGWLHQRTVNVARPMMRAARRRQARESEAMLMNYAMDHQNQFPTNFAQAASAGPGGSNGPTNPVPDQFEIVYRGSTVAITNPGEVIVLREKQPWLNSDGKWVKVYGNADGSVQVVGMPSRWRVGGREVNYETFERILCRRPGPRVSGAIGPGGLL